jgi:hypothetical protein
LDFIKTNKSVDIEPKIIRGKHPHLRAVYEQGQKTLCVRNMSEDQVLNKMQYLRDSRGNQTRNWTQRHVSARPSIQGFWTPHWKPPTHQ